MNALTRKLVVREFYMHRWMIAASIVAGLAGLGVVTRGGIVNFNVGFLVWLTTIAAFGAVVAMFGIATERKERVINWILSLPISPGDYVRIKVLALLLCFLVPWSILCASALTVVVAAPDIPDGLLPFTVLLSVFLLLNYSFVVCSALHLRSEGQMTIAIIVHNIGITLFIFAVATVDGIQRHLYGPVPVWNSAFWCVLAIELAVLALLLALPWFVAARRRDFV